MSNTKNQVLSPITIVGAGNWLISYDKVGPRVLELCENRYGSEVELFDVGTTGLALLDCLKAQDLMFVVDACEGTDGHVRLVEMDFTEDLPQGPGMHQIGPLETLHVAKHLYPEKVPQRIFFILVETDQLDEAAMEKACQDVLAILDREIQSWKSSHLS